MSPTPAVSPEVSFGTFSRGRGHGFWVPFVPSRLLLGGVYHHSFLENFLLLQILPLLLRPNEHWRLSQNRLAPAFPFEGGRGKTTRPVALFVPV